MEIDLSIDRINFRIKDIHVKDFERFSDNLDKFEMLGVLDIRREFRKGMSDYAYNLHIGQGDGAVFIGYRHNGVNAKLARERFDMKVDFNPSKHDWEKYKLFWACMSDFKGFGKGIKGLDLAFDVYKPINKIIPVSVSGKWANKFQDSFYFGQRGSHGFVRIYNKAKEEGLKDIEKTRIEFTIVFKDPVTLQIFKSIREFDIFKDYMISVVDFDKFDAEMACILFSLQHAFRSLKEFSRRKQEKIKRALSETEQIDFQTVCNQNKVELVETIKKILNFEWYKSVCTV